MSTADGGTWLGMPARPGTPPDGAAPPVPSGPPDPSRGPRRLRADCASCFALCCVALPLTASADFAVDKPPGQPCGHLRGDDRCGIHARLRQEGFRGCTVYDCFGAGQRVSQETFGGRSWRGDAGAARQMFAVFPVVRHLHEMLHHLAEAADRAPTDALRTEAGELFERIDALAGSAPETLAAIDVDAHRAAVGELLAGVSAAVRGGGGRSLRRADLVGARLRGADLHHADLRGARLIAADLVAADLRGADLLGTDLRDADLSGADLTGALFLTQPQLDAARGDHATTLPSSLVRPGHWRAGGANPRRTPERAAGRASRRTPPGA